MLFDLFSHCAQNDILARSNFHLRSSGPEDMFNLFKLLIVVYTEDRKQKTQQQNQSNSFIVAKTEAVRKGGQNKDTKKTNKDCCYQMK